MSFALTIEKGDTHSRTVTVTSGGAAFDMTNYILKFIAKRHRNEAEEVISKEITFSSPATGVGVLALTHEDLDVAAREYVCKFKLYNADESFIQTLDSGTLTITDFPVD